MHFEDSVLCEWGLGSIIQLYLELDVQTALFQKQSGVACLSGCGACCENPNIEATELEFLPLGVWLWKTGLGEISMARLQQTKLSGVCAFYQAAAQGGGMGQCGIYPERGLICRLFGFASVINKAGNAVLASCAVMKKTDPQKMREVTEKMSLGQTTAILFTDFYSRLAQINPHWGERYYPINEAMYRMLEKIGLFSYYQGLNNRKG